MNSISVEAYLKKEAPCRFLSSNSNVEALRVLISPHLQILDPGVAILSQKQARARELA